MNHHPAEGLWRWLIMTLRWIWSCLVSLLPNTSKRIKFDTGRQVHMGRQIAEGGFSYVFEASDCQNKQKYALKRILLGDSEMLADCKRECGVHRAVRHKNLMPLLGFSLEEQNTVAYMLFPYMPRSLRHEVNQRMFHDHSTPSPWPEAAALKLYHGILCGVSALHEANFSHRDLKLENVVLQNRQTPVVMDFGSVGALTQSIATRRQVLTMVEDASSHTTLPYRPPELLEGGVRTGDPDVDFQLVDVFSLGCTLFALLYGASPFESEARRGRLRICDCTPLKILSGLWELPPELQQWYSRDTTILIQKMLTPDRSKRIALPQVLTQVEGILETLGERVERPVSHMMEDTSDLEALLPNPYV